MNLSDAEREVEAFFRNYGKNARPALLGRGKGKVYELYCLARTVRVFEDVPRRIGSIRGNARGLQGQPGEDRQVEVPFCRVQGAERSSSYIRISK